MKKLKITSFKTSLSPIWLSISEASNLSGVQDKTIRRAIKNPNSELVFKIVKNRYQVNFASLIIYMHSNLKLKNKLDNFGIGQYVENWKPFK